MRTTERIGMTLLVSVLGALLSACAATPPNTPQVSVSASATLPETMASLAPDGWELSEPVSEFTPGTLYEKINGNAELYLAYDVVRLTFATFNHATNPGQFIDVFVYDMGTPTNGFGIYSVERFEGEPPVDLGRSAYRSGANFFIWKGRYYIQIVASESTETFQEIDRALAGKTASALSDAGEPVWGLTALPPKGRIDESIKFFLVDAMGLDFMKGTYTADYNRGGFRIRAFLSQQPSGESARSTIAQYGGYARKYGDGVENVVIDGIDLMVCAMGSRYDVVFQKGGLAAGVLSVDDRSVALGAATDLWKQLDK